MVIIRSILLSFRRPSCNPNKYFYSTIMSARTTNPTKMAQPSEYVVRRVDNITKSKEDKRLYRGLELVNGMKVLLVSDPSTDKSAAAMDVNVGFLSDPKEVKGLAHFCEHMLFLGTEKYPNENDYNKFLQEHGGTSNATTYMDHTMYYFDIVPEHLKGALDRFAQFFISPLFTESATDREINAVNSENDKNISSDVWRINQLDHHLCDPTHPYNTFGTGNTFTLKTSLKEKNIDIRGELLKFHDKWYSSNIMCLAVLGKESLEELESIVLQLFASVKNKETIGDRWDKHPFRLDQMGTIVYVTPIKDLRNLNIAFPCDDYIQYYKSAPTNYISHLIGHEGPGSILSALKGRGWSNNLVAGQRTAIRGFSFFSISVDLTEEGMKHVDDIIKLIFQYLNMLKKEKPQKWIQDETRDIGNIVFQFKDKESPRGYISNIVNNLQYYPLEDLLSAPYLISDWRPDLIEQVWTKLTPETARVALIAKAYETMCTETEPWYGTKYKREIIPIKTLQEWKECGLCEEFKLPAKNEFIPTDFSLYERIDTELEYPLIIQDTPLTRVWFKQDDKFLLPKANVMFDFVSPMAYLDPLNCNLTHMFVQLFKDELNEYAYAAELAGLKWELINTKYGLILGIIGYNHKQHILLEKVMEKLTNFTINPKRFNILKENYIRHLKNFSAEQPYQHAVYYLTVLLTEHSWSKQELLASTDQMTIERLEAFIPQMLSKMHIESLVHGNANQERALQMVQIVEDAFTSTLNMAPLLPRQLLLNRELKLEDGCNYMYEKENQVHKSSCIEVYYQCGLQSKENNVKLELFCQLIQEPCFNILRTKEQLGYIVFSGVRKSNGVQGLRIIVQSDKHPTFVDGRIENFLDSMKSYIEEMPEEEFLRHREALAAQRLEIPKQLVALTNQFWSEITSQQYHFNRAEVEVAQLRTLTKSDVIDFYNDLLGNDAKKRKKLSVHIVSTADGGAGGITEAGKEESENKPDITNADIISDITTFKSSHELYPLVQPYINITRKGNKCKL
ncbi:hypothetical protein ABEB36_004673 [Hypothenemus hampei]|uniref:Insulin-degrading enzyme n=1 Tax=Hypothenemus hampei TaxID=57062 RepID=A0ABD1F421_HYPHA